MFEMTVPRWVRLLVRRGTYTNIRSTVLSFMGIGCGQFMGYSDLDTSMHVSIVYSCSQEAGS
jgi:hypothetical protein